jgi:anti-anti-sigma regulatory factor
MEPSTMPLAPGRTPDFQAIFQGAPELYLVLAPDLTIVAVNDAYAGATMTVREDILGRALFEVFPDNPEDAAASGVHNLRTSLQRVLDLRRPDAMPVQKYDVQRPASEGGGFEVRYWSPLNTPVLDANGEVAWIIHRVADVTAQIAARDKAVEQDRIAQDNGEVILRLRRANDELSSQAAELARRASQIRRLSIPVLPVRQGLLLLPIIGEIDPERGRQISEGLLNAIRLGRAKVAVIDLTGAEDIGASAANDLLQLAAGAQLMGATTIVTGLSAANAQTMADLGIDLGGLTTMADLQTGLEAAEQILERGRGSPVSLRRA